LILVFIFNLFVYQFLDCLPPALLDESSDSDEDAADASAGGTYKTKKKRKREKELEGEGKRKEEEKEEMEETREEGLNRERDEAKKDTKMGGRGLERGTEGRKVMRNGRLSSPSEHGQPKLDSFRIIQSRYAALRLHLLDGLKNLGFIVCVVMLM
jgi:hypothetical protein